MLKYIFGLILLSSCAVAFSAKGLLGVKECTWGPSYWCSNITNAKNCNAVKHCIQTVWEHQKPSGDEDNICGICKAMIKDARDQLESNETVSMIKEVFEQSCHWLVIKPIVKKCIMFSDEYADELVDMLSSQMNPDVICTIVGLCSNAEIDKMYEDINNKKARDEERNKELQKDCESCMDFADVIGKEMERATPNDIKSYLLERCRSLGSLSVACSNLVDEYGQDIYDKLKKDFSPSSLCYLTSSCVNGYGRKVLVKTESNLGVIHVNSDAISVAVKHLSEDQTCELCKTLVKHLKDVLISNTTEIEFKQVLKGICKQTGKFRSECLSIVDEYYKKIYEFIVNDLDGKEVCSFAGICTRPGVYNNGPVAPLLPEAPVPVKEDRVGSVSVAKSDSGIRVFTPIAHSPVKVEISFGDPLEPKFQLPIERMAISHTEDLNVNNRETCMFCQYVLHYIQKIISQPYGERALKEAVDKVCDVLPQSVTLQCRNFVQEFGDAFVAILAQEIDPSQVCPALRACPARVLENKFEPLEIGGSPGCPLCLMVIEDISEKLKDNKTEDAIRKALHNLCSRMSASLRPQCDEFVQKYEKEVLDMMLADFTPQEVCTFLKLCHTNVDVELVAPHPEEKHEIMTNEIPRLETERTVQQETPPMCFLCEFVMDKIRLKLRNNRTEDEIKRVVLNICNTIPKSIQADCHDFVRRYAEYIVNMLENHMDARMVCQEMHMCEEHVESLRMDYVFRAVEECAVCEALSRAVRGLLDDKNFDRNLSKHSAQICHSIPLLKPNQMQRCESIVLAYGPSVMNLFEKFHTSPELVCPRLKLCDGAEQRKVEIVEPTTEVPESLRQKKPPLLGADSCMRGPSYWCQSVDHAKQCGTLLHCREIVWKAEEPPTRPRLLL